MAERRMFSKKVIDSDKFLDMPLSAQNVYFHLSMRADDDGFLNNAQKTIRMIGASKEDYEILLSCGFVIDFGNGICVITHWNMNNYIRSDRYKETVHQDEMSRLTLTRNKIYELIDNKENKECKEDYRNVQESSNEVFGAELCEEVHGIPDGDILETQYRLGEISEDKDSVARKSRAGDKDRESVDKSGTTETHVHCEEKIMEKWNSIGISRISCIQNNRKKLLKARIAEYGIEQVMKAVDNIQKSAFLRGQNSRGWIITFDWLIRPNNFIKVLEGNYDDKKHESLQNKSYVGNHKDKSGFCDFPQRDYDYDELEKKLLGWN